MACKYIAYPYLNQSEAGMALVEISLLYLKAAIYREMSGFVHMYIVYDMDTPVGKVCTCCRKDLFQC